MTEDGLHKVEPVWKVCLKRGDRYESISCPDEGVVQYSIGVTTTPNKDCGPLVAFRTLKAAREFINSLSLLGTDKVVIFRCRAVTIRRVWPPVWVSNGSGRWSIHGDMPEGTVFCQEVTPLRLVPDRQG